MHRLYHKRRSSFTIKERIIALLLVVAALIMLVDVRLRPMIKAMAANQAKVFATRAINNAIATAMAGNGQPYENLVRVTTDQKGDVTSVQTDTARLNLLKAELTDAASMRIAQLEEQKINIPIGTLLGNQLLSGRGPRIEFKIVPAGYASSRLIHHFDSAGINQTRHQIILELNATILAILPGYTAATEITTNVMLAETVIVGVSPQSFTQVLTDENGRMPSLIADYGAGKND